MAGEAVNRATRGGGLTAQEARMILGVEEGMPWPEVVKVCGSGMHVMSSHMFYQTCGGTGVRLQLVPLVAVAAAEWGRLGGWQLATAVLAWQRAQVFPLSTAPTPASPVATQSPFKSGAQQARLRLPYQCTDTCHAPLPPPLPCPRSGTSTCLR